MQCIAFILSNIIENGLMSAEKKYYKLEIVNNNLTKSLVIELYHIYAYGWLLRDRTRRHDRKKGSLLDTF